MPVQYHLIQGKLSFNQTLAQANNGYDAGEIRQEIKSMAFVNEIISEAEKEKITFPVSTRRDGSKPTLSKWTIDRGREAYLVVTHIWGGGYEGTPEEYRYVLNWKGALIHFSAGHQLSGSKDTGYVLSWRVYRLNIPSTLQDMKEEILQLIREALDIRGRIYDREVYAAVNVNFDISTSL